MRQTFVRRLGVRQRLERLCSPSPLSSSAIAVSNRCVRQSSVGLLHERVGWKFSSFFREFKDICLANNIIKLTMPPSRAKQRQAGFLPVVKYLDTLITGLLSCRATYCTHIGIHLGFSCLVQNTGQEAVMLILCVVTGCLSPTGTFCLFLVLLNMANGVKSQILSSLWILASHIWFSFFPCRYILLNAYI